MPKTKKVRSAGRFGARYGLRVRKEVEEIEVRQKQKQPCPFCGKQAKRLAKGLWYCKRCGKRFTGQAYWIK